jgi:ribosome biogenesis GTPase A
MATAKRVLRCHNCGAILQSDSPKQIGYISKEIIENGVPRIPYCNNCYQKMVTLNAGSLLHETDKDIIKILNDAVATDSLIVWVVDLFSFNGTLNPDVVRKVKKLNVIVIGSKRDLFPKDVTDSMLIRYLDERFSEFGINPVDIKLIGNEDQIDINTLRQAFKEQRKYRDIYLIGEVNSGKTTLINKFLKNYVNTTKWQIKTELYPGTNSSVLEIPLSNSSYLYELPDLSNSTSVLSKVEKDLQKIIVPKKEVVMTRKFIGEGSAIMVGNLAVLYIISGHRTSVRTFMSEKTEIKVCAINKVDDLLKLNLKKKFCRPVSERFDSFRDYDMFEYELEDDDLRHDISVEGLCWFSTRGKGQTLRILLPKGCAVKECLSKVR